MKNTLTLTASAALVSSSAALADVSGLIGQETLRYYAADGLSETTLDDAAFAVIDLFVEFRAENTHGYSNADTRMLSTYSVNLSTDGFAEYFYQNDFIGSGSGAAGSWKPNYSLDSPGISNSTIDSFITIGGGVGAEAARNRTATYGFTGSNSSIFNDNIGWYLNPPTSTQADVIDFEVWYGRFVVTGDDARAGANFDLAGTITNNYGSGTEAFYRDISGTFYYTPAPGALALIGLAGLGARRRRA